MFVTNTFENLRPHLRFISVEAQCELYECKNKKSFDWLASMKTITASASDSIRYIAIGKYELIQIISNR